MRLSEQDLRKLLSDDVKALNPHLFTPEGSKSVPKANKFGARKTEVGGIIFDSGIEARRYRELLLLQQAGIISDLKLQVPFVLQEAFVDASGQKQRQIIYTADFTYKDSAGLTVIEDVKSAPTAKGEAFRVRWRLLLNKFKGDTQTKCLLTS